MSLERRERRVIAWGAAVVALALTGITIGLPLRTRFVAREALIDARRSELARLQAVAASDSQLADAVVERQGVLAAAPQRVLFARSQSLAAAALQDTLRRYGEESMLSIASLDVSPAPDSSDASVLPASMSGFGDIRATAGFLDRVQHGPLRLEIRELRIRPNSALIGEPLQLSITVAAPFPVGAAP